MCLNMNGNLVKNKDCPEFLDCLRENDIVLLSECWINKTNDLRIDGYVKPTCKFRTKKRGQEENLGGSVVLLERV